jgi:hypothetical protein
MVWLGELGKLKKRPITLSGLEPATSRFVAQSLNHLRYHVLLQKTLKYLKLYPVHMWLRADLTVIVASKVTFDLDAVIHSNMNDFSFHWLLISSSRFMLYATASFKSEIGDLPFSWDNCSLHWLFLGAWEWNITQHVFAFFPDSYHFTGMSYRPLKIRPGMPLTIVLMSIKQRTCIHHGHKTFSTHHALTIASPVYPG